MKYFLFKTTLYLFISFFASTSLFAQGKAKVMPSSTNGGGMVMGFPDVCLVPAPPAPFVPIPYASITFEESDNKKSTTKTKTKTKSVTVKGEVPARISSTNEYIVGIENTNTKSVTYTIKGQGLERIGKAIVYIDGIENNNMFEATLEPIAEGAKNIDSRKITITAKKGPMYLSKMNLNIRRSLDSEPILNDKLFPQRANLVQKPRETADFKIISSGEYFEDRLYTKINTRKTNSIEIKSYAKKVNAEKGTMIGFEYEYLGKAAKKYSFKIIHPRYSAGPEKGATGEVFTKLCQVNERDHFIWQFTEDHEMLSGEWILQILDGGKTIYEHSFLVSFGKQTMQRKNQ